MPGSTKNLLPAAAVFLLGLALCLPGLISLPVTDRDEARYVQASRQMVESGDYLRIRFLDTARNKKPAGIYWLQAAAVRIAGVKDAVWPYRLPSVAGALMAALLVLLLARRLEARPEDEGLDGGTNERKTEDGSGGPLWPALALAAAPLLVVVAHAATTDAVTLVTACAAQAALASVYLAARESAAAGGLAAALVFWTALGVGILVKGPVTPLVAALTILALCLHDRDARWLRGLRPVLGLPLLLLIVLPWLLAIQRATGGAFLHDSVGRDFLAKVQGGQEQHGAPPGYYLLGVSLLFWPLFPLAWRGIGAAWRARRADPTAAFLLAWLLPAWLVLEFVPTKLPHYVLPLYPALALLALRGRDDAAPTNRRWRVACRIVDGAWWVAAALWMAAPPFAAWLLGREVLPAAAVCAFVAGVATVAIRRMRSRNRTRQAVAAATAFALLYFGVLFGVVLPRLDDLWLTRRVAGMVAAQAPVNPAQVVSLGYEEPSLAFALGSQTRLGLGVDGTVAELRRNPAAVALVQDAPVPPGGNLRARLEAALRVAPKGCFRERFLAAAAQAGVRVREAGAVEGWNYSRTRRVRVILFVQEEVKP